MNLFTRINSAVKAFFSNRNSLLICVLFWLLRGAVLITSSIYHCSVVRQKNFPGKLKSAKLKLFTGINSAVKASLSNWNIFLICILFQLLRGAALITSSIYHSCVIRQKEFSSEVEMRKVDSFYWNRLSSKSCYFELE